MSQLFATTMSLLTISSFHLPSLLHEPPTPPHPYPNSLLVSYRVGNFLQTCFYLGNSKGSELFFEGL